MAMTYFDGTHAVRFKLMARMNLGRMLILGAVVVVLTSALHGTAAAQTAGTLAGRVLDESGAVLPGVTVSARHTNTRLERTTTSDAQGRYTLASLPPGPYELRAELSGFRPLLRTGLTLTIAQALAVDLTMTVGGLAEAVTVIGDASPVNTRTGELSYLVDERAIEELPLNGRNYTDLALLQPTVVAYPHRDGGSVVAHGLGMSVNGQDPRSNVYLLDGTLLNDMTNGPAGSAAGTALGMETVQEFRVETNAYSAEFGRMSGGQINVLTKAGSNDFRGSAYEFHRNDALDAANYFDVAGKPPFTRNQFGGAAGGPLQRDRLFLLRRLRSAAREPGADDHLHRTRRQRARRAAAGSGHPERSSTSACNAGVAPYLAEYPRANGRALGDGTALYNFQFDQRLRSALRARDALDYNLGPGSQLFGRYTIDDAEQYLPTDYPQFPRYFVSRNQFFTGEYQQAISDRTLATYRLGYSRTRVGQAGRGQHRRRRCSRSCPGARLSATSTSAASTASARRARSTCAFSSRCSACRASVARSHGRHLLGVGGACRALPAGHGESDVQPRHLLVRQPARVSREPRHQLHRPHAAGAVRSLLAVLAARRLRRRTSSPPPIV